MDRVVYYAGCLLVLCFVLLGMVEAYNRIHISLVARPLFTQAINSDLPIGE